MDSFEAKICTRVKKDGHVFKQTPSRRKTKTGHVSLRFASDCSARVARARNKTTRRRAKPMEENIVDVLLYSSVSFALFEEQETSLPRSRIRPMIIQSFVLLFICLSVIGGFPSQSRSTSLFAPARTCIDRATRKSNSTKCILTAVVDPNCAIDIVSAACVQK